MKKEIKLSSKVLISSQNSLVQELSYLSSITEMFRSINYAKSLEQSEVDLRLSLNKTYIFLENFINQLEIETQEFVQEIDLLTEMENNINTPTKLF